MKNLKYIAAVLGLVLVLVIVASLVLDKKLEEDSTFVSDIVDFDKLNVTSSNNESNKKDLKLSDNTVFSENPEDNSDSSENGMFMKATLTREEWQNRIDNGINSSGLREADIKCKKLYYYSHLDDFKKQLYLEIYICLRDLKTGIPLCSTSTDEIDEAFNCVMYDHPEIFYADGYLVTRYSLNDEIALIEISPAFTMTKEEINEQQKYVDAYAKAFLDNLPKNSSEYEKIKFAYEFVILTTDYDTNAVENQNIISVCRYQKSVCKGYAKTFQYLTSLVGVKSTVISGTVGNGDGHAWNLVVCNDQYYYVDCTWGDSSYMANYQSTHNSDDINYDYLNITTVELQKTHTISDFVEVPLCNATKNNYYVREELYFTSVDEEQLKKAFKFASYSDRNTVEIKCSNQSVYNRMGQYLFDEQNVFYYLPSKSSSMKVFKNPDLLIYSIPLE